MSVVRIFDHSSLAAAGHRPSMVIRAAIPGALPLLRPPVFGEYLQRPQIVGRRQGAAQQEAPQSIDLSLRVGRTTD
jgi:hypothetical protein